MKPQFNFLIEQNSESIIVYLNGGVNCMFRKDSEHLYVNKQELLGEIEYMQTYANVTVDGLELLEN